MPHKHDACAGRFKDRRASGYPSPGGTMLVEVTCRCGWRCRGTEDEVIAQVQEHGRTAHGLETSPDEVRAIWRVVDDGATGA
jgi:predicted small metal-binding protein